MVIKEASIKAVGVGSEVSGGKGVRGEDDNLCPGVAL